MRALNPADRKLVSDSIDKASRSAKPLALLVLGHVGSGKTTFINHVRHVREYERFEPRKDQAYPHWIYIDCRTLASTESPLDFIVTHMHNYIQRDDFLSDYERCIKHAYREQIQASEKGALSLLAFDENEKLRRIAEMILEEEKQKKPYVERILKYAAENTAVFLIIDNVDQFESEQAERIFSDSMALAQRLSLSLVVAMRDSTFVANKSRPIFDAFDFDPIQVEAPNIASVLARRLAVAKELLKGKRSEYVGENGARISLDDSSIIIDLISQSVLDSEVGNIISVFSTGDIRLCLRMTREFLRNGYTATGKAMQIYQRTGRYTLPQHEAIRAIMLGSQNVYSEEYSPVANPFDSKLSINRARNCFCGCRP